MSAYLEYYRQNRVDLIYGAVVCEDGYATKQQVEDLVLNNKEVNLPSRSGNFIMNVERAFAYLLNFKQDVDDFDYVRVLKGFQETLSIRVDIGYIEERYRGRFRETHISIKGCSYTPPIMESRAFESVCRRLMADLRFRVSVDMIILTYIQLLKTRFFVSSNEMSAYMFANYMLYVTDSGYLLQLPKTSEGSKSFHERLLEYYEDYSKEESLVRYIKQYLLRKVYT